MVGKVSIYYCEWNSLVYRRELVNILLEGISMVNILLSFILTANKNNDT